MGAGFNPFPTAAALPIDDEGVGSTKGTNALQDYMALLSDPMFGVMSSMNQPGGFGIDASLLYGEPEQIPMPDISTTFFDSLAESQTPLDQEIADAIMAGRSLPSIYEILREGLGDNKDVLSDYKDAAKQAWEEYKVAEQATLTWERQMDEAQPVKSALAEELEKAGIPLDTQYNQANLDPMQQFRTDDLSASRGTQKDMSDEIKRLKESITAGEGRLRQGQEREAWSARGENMMNRPGAPQGGSRPGPQEPLPAELADIMSLAEGSGNADLIPRRRPTEKAAPGGPNKWWGQDESPSAMVKRLQKNDPDVLMKALGDQRAKQKSLQAQFTQGSKARADASAEDYETRRLSEWKAHKLQEQGRNPMSDAIGARNRQLRQMGLQI